MTAVQPYEAWFCFDADDPDEVNEIVSRWGTDEEGWQRWPSPDEDLVEKVTVIAVEKDDGVEYVWFLRKGQAERRESWQVRVCDIGAELVGRVRGHRNAVPPFRRVGP